MSKTPADLIIEPSWLLPIVPKGVVLSEHAVVVSGSRIVTIGPVESVHARYDGTTRMRLPGQLLMPGLVNAHGHAAMVLLRGLAEDLPFDAWLRERVWPIEAEHVSPQFVADGVALALVEMLKSGTTCFSDMYFFPDVTADVVRSAGMRAQIAFPLLKFPNAWSSSAADAFHKGLALHDAYRSDALIRIAFGPHSPYALERDDLVKTLMLADEIDAPIHMHLHETAEEVAVAKQETGRSHIHALSDIGMLVPRLQAIHLTQVDDDELDLLVEGGVNAIHCPQSNLKLGSGLADIERMRRKGLCVGLGTDGAAANDSLDLFTEARVAALLAKTLTRDAAALDAFDALELATLGSARALGLDGQIGSIEPGKSADLITVDLTHTGALPVHRPASTLMYTASGSHVRHAWIAGRHVLEDGRPTTMDERDVHARAASWSVRLATVS